MKKRKNRVGGISKKFTQTLYYTNAKRLYKSFGVQSRSGGIGRRASLISWLVYPNLAGSRFSDENPVSGALT